MSKAPTLRYDMTKPCKDCPFLRSSKLHEGICNSLVQYKEHIENDTFAHSCHKTDRRADSEEGQSFTGATQHCAGALAMMAQRKMLTQSHAFDSLSIAQWKKLEKVTGLYDSLIDIAGTYYVWLKTGRKPNTTGIDILLGSNK